MSEVPTAIKKKRNNRKKIKRRTAISDSDESSSSSDNDTVNVETEVVPLRNIEDVSGDIKVVPTEKYEDVQLSDNDLSNIDMVDDEQSETIVTSNRVGIAKDIKDKVTTEENSKKSGNKLKNEFLSLIFTNYGDDINKLREAPDFSEKSLSILANVLKDGANMFDEDTLKSILEDK